MSRVHIELQRVQTWLFAVLRQASPDVLERVAPIFFGDPKTAAMRVLRGLR